MPFPTTSLLDSFNRADGALGPNWTNPVEVSNVAPTILSNRVICANSSFGDAYWNQTMFDSEVEVYATIPAAATDQTDTFLSCRITNPGTASINMYQADFSTVSQNVTINRVVGGSFVSRTTVPLALAAGWKVGLRATTATDSYLLEAWYDSGGGWTLATIFREANGPVLYPALHGPGYIGFNMFGAGDATRSLDDFGGGTVVALDPPQSPPTIHGRGAA